PRLPLRPDARVRGDGLDRHAVVGGDRAAHIPGHHALLGQLGDGIAQDPPLVDRDVERERGAIAHRSRGDALPELARARPVAPRRQQRQRRQAAGPRGPRRAPSPPRSGTPPPPPPPPPPSREKTPPPSPPPRPGFPQAAASAPGVRGSPPGRRLPPPPGGGPWGGFPNPPPRRSKP